MHADQGLLTPLCPCSLPPLCPHLPPPPVSAPHGRACPAAFPIAPLLQTNDGAGLVIDGFPRTALQVSHPVMQQISSPAALRGHAAHAWGFSFAAGEHGATSISICEVLVMVLTSACCLSTARCRLTL
jgi:hypothetical protein